MERTHFHKFPESKAEQFNLTSSFWCMDTSGPIPLSDASRTLGEVRSTTSCMRLSLRRARPGEEMVTIVPKFQCYSFPKLTMAIKTQNKKTKLESAKSLTVEELLLSYSYIFHSPHLNYDLQVDENMIHLQLHTFLVICELIQKAR